MTTKKRNWKPQTALVHAGTLRSGFGETSGFVASSLIMLIIAASLYIVFKRKKWL